MWPLDVIPSGFLVCDGSEVSQVTYADLYAILGDNYGAASPGMFRLPDARGYFPRCYGSVTVDPDAGTRTDRGDGITGNAVGTTQADAFVQHTHDIRQGSYGSGGVFNAWAGAATFLTLYTNNFGDSDTRPKNIYLNLIIKW